MKNHWIRRVIGLIAIAVMAVAALSWRSNVIDNDRASLSPRKTTTIIIVRHTERDPGLDPPLNAEGLVRASVLADELADKGITAMFFPDLLRNRQTAGALIERLDPDPAIRTYPTQDMLDTKVLARRFVDEVVNDHSGGTVLWIGNTGPAIKGIQSGNLQEIFLRLGGEGKPPVKYRDMFTVVLRKDMPPEITRRTYGGPSSLDQYDEP